MELCGSFSQTTVVAFTEVVGAWTFVAKVIPQINWKLSLNWSHLLNQRWTCLSFFKITLLRPNCWYFRWRAWPKWNRQDLIWVVPKTERMALCTASSKSTMMAVGESKNVCSNGVSLNIVNKCSYLRVCLSGSKQYNSG